MKTRLFFLLFFSVVSICLWAVPACPKWQTIEQPDGSVIELRLVGDEYYHYWINRDGLEVVQNTEGYWVVKPEQLSAPQRQARSLASAKRAEVNEMRKAAVNPLPTRMLVILVNFSDVAITSSHDNAFFDDMLNGTNHQPYGSAWEYFYTTSDSLYSPHWDVYGPVTLDSAMVYYGGNDNEGEDLRPREMAWEACKKADALGCDFSLYDADNNGTVDNVYIIYAGYGESSGGGANTIWPHSWSINSSEKLDGKYLNKYGCSSELDGSASSNPNKDADGIGTFCHEFSHVLGMPDYYDTKYGENYSNHRTPGNWSLMDGGSYNGGGHRPPLYSIFDKCYMGWAKMPALLRKDDRTTLSMPVGTSYARHITGTNTAAKFTSTDTVYYLENRQKAGKFDGSLPGHGLVIWQVVYRSNWSSVNDEPGVLRYTLLSAKGSTSGISSGADPFPGTGKKTSVTVRPNCVITNITESNKVISFKYNGGGDEYTHTWIANGTTFTSTKSYASLSLPTSSPAACSSGRTFYGWTQQTHIQKDGSDVVLAKTYDVVEANNTYYAVYRSASAPYDYSFLCADSTYTTFANAKAVIVKGQDITIGSQTVDTPGVYPYDTIRTIYGDSVLAVNLSWADPNKTIVYTAPAQLAEGTGTSSTYGLHTDKFGQAIMEHYFSNGIGVIAFDHDLTTVGNYAFFGCRKGLNNELTTVQLPNTVTSIGTNAFSNCWEVAQIDWPTGLKKIGNTAFYKCFALDSVVLPDGVDTIGDNVFQSCTKLRHVTLSEGLKLIGHTVFTGCSSLVDITSRSLKPAASYSTTFSGITPANIVLKVWPSRMAKYSTTTYWKAFTNIQPIYCGTTASWVTEDTTLYVGNAYTWQGKTLTQSGVYLDTTYTDIYGCDTVISQLTLTYKVDSANAIFYTAPKQLKEVEKNSELGVHIHAFGQKLWMHTFADSVGCLAFGGPITKVGYHAFYGCRDDVSQVKTITLPATIDTIELAAFYACYQLRSINIPEGVRYIGDSAFHRCRALDSIHLPEGLERMGIRMLNECTNLQSLVIPSTVKALGNAALRNCTSLQSITCLAVVPPTCETASCFTNVSSSTPLYVYFKCQAAYEADNGWKYFTTILPIDAPATAVDAATENNTHPARKFMRDGQLWIERNGAVFNAQGVLYEGY